MKRFISVGGASAVICVLSLAWLTWLANYTAVRVCGQSTTFGRAFHVSGLPIPSATLSSPVPAEGGVLTASLIVDTLTIANPDSASHTVTVQDGQAPPYQLFNAYTVPATTTWTVLLAGTRFGSGFKWAASQLTNTDLAIDGTLNTKVTAASHTFVATDIGKTITVTAGTSFTVGAYVIASISGSAAVVGSAVGTVGSTGGTWSMPMVLGTVTGRR